MKVQQTNHTVMHAHYYMPETRRVNRQTMRLAALAPLFAPPSGQAQTLHTPYRTQTD